MERALQQLLTRLNEPWAADAAVIRWSCPVPVFGDSTRARVATVGLNPSNREFVDDDGNELDGDSRRFHTLRSLELQTWADASATHIKLIAESCRYYFSRNPYDGWFRQLEHILSNTEASYYHEAALACHLDLTPYATVCKWGGLGRAQQEALRTAGAAALGELVRDSRIELLILNGKSVVEQFEAVAGTQLNKQVMPGWQLRRRGRVGVQGHGYTGTIDCLAGVSLGREIGVAGFNHNIQSSFGVSKEVRDAIRDWVGEIAGTVSW